MNIRKDIIKIIEEKGFSIKGKTCPRWKICYSMKSFDESYEITISPLTKKEMLRVLMEDIDYWKYVGLPDVQNKKQEKEALNLIEKLKDIVKQIGEKKWKAIN